MTETNVERNSSLAVLFDDLPGEAVPYAIAAGEGRRTLVGGMLVTEIARPIDTGAAFAAAWVSGPLGARVPAARAEEELFLFVVDGVVELDLDGALHRLTPGDSAHIAAGDLVGWTMRAHTNRILHYSSEGRRQEQLVRMGAAFSGHSHQSEAQLLDPASWADLGAEYGVTLAGTGEDPAASGRSRIVRAADGERWASHAQLNSYLARARDTDGSYFAMHTRGARSPWIPRHRHHLHTENFLCLDGRARIEANGTDILLTRGDFLHAPAGTIHSFRFERSDTQMLGLLTTGIFEPFFEFMNEPTRERTPDESGEPWFPVAAFEQARAELDVEVVGPPPES
ncbi:cupin domain-containing protein (plasmid) [Rathayibacter sp. VKM Ac-2803]|uniref:Cupin domain-containing protein n=1 Tax=Rathayibacter caricis DSM 15933 TaxID=1328867 RepID=A0A2T4UNW0_9MICO|nr:MULTISPECIES: cupin domain-containing protein [Rathayibacter]MWV51381.1 cupin domain-containing protein [Rathayibacter sp. VKM Ac-2803]PTL71212.1 cupin domain-containing protein [Rathayibacter caricis DSM 15933]